MLIAIDIGNTNTGIGLISGKKILKTDFIKTGTRGCYEKRLTKALRALASDERTANSEKGHTPYAVVICSVVPKALTVSKRCVKKVFKSPPKVVGKDIIVPINNKYEEPKQVGQDRLVCAYAASQIYGVPAVVVDLGTAITLDVVAQGRGKGARQNAEYLGGMIVAGIRLSVEALHDKTALLPKVEIHKPKRLIGRTTQESMLSGIFYGYGEMIQGLIGLLCKQLKEKPRVIVTGGYSDVMKRYICGYRCVADKNLIFKGIACLAAFKEEAEFSK